MRFWIGLLVGVAGATVAEAFLFGQLALVNERLRKENAALRDRAQRLIDGSP